MFNVRPSQAGLDLAREGERVFRGLGLKRGTRNREKEDKGL